MNGNLEPEENVLEPNVQLMYKAPGREEHQSVVEVLDEIYSRLDRIESFMEEGIERLNNIETVGGSLLNKINVDVEEILEEVAE